MSEERSERCDAVDVNTSKASGSLLAWFAERGWALGGAIAGAVIGVFTSPPYNLVNQGWFATASFLTAAVGMAGVAIWPWSKWVRLGAVTAMVFAASGRAWSLVFLSDADEAFRIVGSAAWLLLGYYTWLLGMFTVKAGQRARR